MTAKLLAGEQMIESGPYPIEGFRIDPSTVRIVRSGDGVVISYGVHEELVVDGERTTLDAFDTSLWQRDGEGWKCVLHTESIAGDAFGRAARRSWFTPPLVPDHEDGGEVSMIKSARGADGREHVR